MRDLLRLCIAMCLCMFAFVACDEKEETPPGEKALGQVIEKLEELDGVDNFTEALKSIGTINLENDQLTVFAVKDDGVKSAGTKANLSTSQVKRQLAKGRHDVSTMKDGDTKELESVAGEVIMVIKANGVITINGQEMTIGIPVTVGNCIIFIVPELIPEYEEEPDEGVEREIAFFISEINENWEEGQPDTYQSEGAAVILYKEDETTGKLVAIDTLLTNKEGIATHRTQKTEGLYYRVEKGNKTPFIEGYRVAGLFTTKDEITYSPSYETGTYLDQKDYGSIMLIDINGDGIVRKAGDWCEYDYMEIDWEWPGVEIVIVSPPNAIDGSWEAELQRCEEEWPVLFREILAIVYEVDTMLVNGYAGFPTLNNIQNQLSQLWHNSYTYITGLNRNIELFESIYCPEEYRNEWNNLYFSEMAQNVAYLYSILTNYFGDVPLVTDSNMKVPQASIKEIAEYLDIFIQDVKENEKYAIMAIQSRMYLNPDVNEYQRASRNYSEIRNFKKYEFGDDMNAITLMGPYDLAGDGNNVYPICLPEIYLGHAEAVLELGNTLQAALSVNQVQLWLNINTTGSTPGEVRAAIKDLSIKLLENEDKTFMLYKRWGILQQELGGFDFKSHNVVLPIPISALQANPNLKQNTGY